MTQLGLTEAEQKLAMIDPGFTGAGVTTRIDGFIHGQEIKFVEYNAENPSSLSDQEGRKPAAMRIAVDVDACAALPPATILSGRKITRDVSRMERQRRAKHRDRGLEKSAHSERVHPAARSFRGARRTDGRHYLTWTGDCADQPRWQDREDLAGQRLGANGSYSSHSRREQMSSVAVGHGTKNSR
jgi:hypothetical protein